MMRKEEMKRHERYDRNRCVELDSSDPRSDRYHEHAAGDTITKKDVDSRQKISLLQKRRRGPTILRDESSSFTSYSFSRQSFCVPEAVPTGKNDIEIQPLDEEIAELGDEPPSKRRKNTYAHVGDDEDYDEAVSSDEDVEDLTAVNFSPSFEKEKQMQYEEKGMEEADKVESEKRFFISSGSSRAPKLTNNLEARLKKATRKKKE